MYHNRILGEFVEVRYALDEDITGGGDTGQAAFADWLEDGKERVGIVTGGYDVWCAIFADETRGFVGGVLAEVGREIGVGLEGRLDGYDGV